MTVRSSGAQGGFVATHVGEGGAGETVAASSRDPIRRDKERAERAAFERLKAELQHAFAAREESYRPMTSAEIIARNG